jgi:hypothetical protein
LSAFADPRDGRRALLSLLADGEHLLELRCLLPTGKWKKRWARTVAAADEIAASMTGRADVYVGVSPRLGRDGPDAKRYAPCRVLWADHDTRRAVENLNAFDPAPTMIVLSGGIDDGVARRYGYWALAEPLPTGEVKRHARRLAHCLGADMASAEPARILRVPGSINHKTGRVAIVEEFTGEVHDLDAITGGLEDPPGRERIASGDDDDDGYLIPAGQRYPHLTRFAGLLRSAGVNETTLVECGMAFLRHQCEQEPPMDFEEAEAKLRQMYDDWEPTYTPPEER